MTRDKEREEERERERGQRDEGLSTYTCVLAWMLLHITCNNIRPPTLALWASLSVVGP